MKPKANLFQLQEMKRKGEPVTWITSYDYPFSWSAEQAGVDMILVGDSGGMVQLGYETTNPVTMDEMITLAKSARRGAPKTFLIGDMPQGSYEPSPRDAVVNAMRFIKEAGCDAIKCEGGRRIIPQVKAMVDAGIPVIGHLGLTPQSTASFGGYRVQCKTLKSFEDTMEDALALQAAGVFAILLEAMPSEPARQIAQQLEIPIYGIGVGGDVDGQLIIMHDATGFYAPFRPWFAKCMIPQVLGEFQTHLQNLGDAEALRKAGRESRNDGLLVLVRMAIEAYIKEVKNKQFPGKEFSYEIKDEALAELKKSKYWH